MNIVRSISDDKQLMREYEFECFNTDNGDCWIIGDIGNGTIIELFEVVPEVMGGFGYFFEDPFLHPIYAHEVEVATRFINNLAPTILEQIKECYREVIAITDRLYEIAHKPGVDPPGDICEAFDKASSLLDQAIIVNLQDEYERSLPICKSRLNSLIKQTRKKLLNEFLENKKE